MMIYKNSKKGGFALGSNSLTAEKLVAGGITAAVALVVALVLGMGKKKSKKKKKGMALSAFFLPAIYKAVKGAIENNSIKVTMDEETKAYFDSLKDDGGIEVVDAIEISSEEEVYEHI